VSDFNPYDWERCTHESIGLPGCPTCDPDKHRVAARYEQRLGVLRAQLAASEARCRVMREALDNCLAELPKGLSGSIYGNAHKKGRAALTQPADDGALRELLIRAVQAAWAASSLAKGPSEVADAVLRGER
jgi:hypothetical protein